VLLQLSLRPADLISIRLCTYSIMQELATCSQSQRTVESMVSAHGVVSGTARLRKGSRVRVRAFAMTDRNRGVSRLMSERASEDSHHARTWRRSFPCTFYCSCTRLYCKLHVLSFIVVVIALLSRTHTTHMPSVAVQQSAAMHDYARIR